jgi:hypothetical protein
MVLEFVGLASYLPTPANIVCEDSTQRRAGTGTCRVDDIYDTLPQTSVAKGNKVAQQYTDNGGHATTTNALEDLLRLLALYSSGIKCLLKHHNIHEQQSIH